jgi:ferritin-like metal-binding protein YciE
MKEILTPSIVTLHELLDFDARKFTNAEVQLQHSLPIWINKSTSVKLKEVLLKYQDYVALHIEKLDMFFVAEDISSLSTMNRIMHAFIEEIGDKLNYCMDNEVKDACLLAGIQGINHFKISSYGTAAAFAKTLGMDKAAEIFHEAEVNEKQIDDRLSQLAEFEVNKKARAPISISE